MRPGLEDKEKRNWKFIIRFTQEEKLRIKALTREGKYACMSDYVRSRIFNSRNRKVITFEQQTKEELQKLDYELNKIGVNLNQLSKRMNSFAGYRIDDKDRHLLTDAFDIMNSILTLLQRNFK